MTQGGIRRNLVIGNTADCAGRHAIILLDRAVRGKLRLALDPRPRAEILAVEMEEIEQEQDEGGGVAVRRISRVRPPSDTASPSARKKVKARRAAASKRALRSA